jgi:hypothetical protein
MGTLPFPRRTVAELVLVVHPLHNHSTFASKQVKAAKREPAQQINKMRIKFRTGQKNILHT